MSTVLTARHTNLPVWAGARPDVSLGHFAWLTPWSLWIKCSVRHSFRQRQGRPKARTTSGDKSSRKKESQFLELIDSVTASVPANYTRNR
jgi:hypothetical protein